jgi:hypothetical protein
MTAPLALGSSDVDPSRRDQLQVCASLVTHYEDWSFAARVGAEARTRGLALLAVNADYQANLSKGFFWSVARQIVGYTSGVTSQELHDMARRFLAAGGR